MRTLLIALTILAGLAGYAVGQAPRPKAVYVPLTIGDETPATKPKIDAILSMIAEIAPHGAQVFDGLCYEGRLDRIVGYGIHQNDNGQRVPIALVRCLR